MASKPQSTACIPRNELRSKECIDNVLKPLIDHIDIPINGTLTNKDIFHTTISMAVDKNSIHSITKRYENIPCETSIRYHLKKLDMNNLIESNEQIMIQKAIESLKTDKKYEFAIDYTNDPYYGNIDVSNEKYVIRGQSKKSTNSFYSYISLYIIKEKERFTISVLPVEKGKSKVEYLGYFMDLITRLNLRLRQMATPLSIEIEISIWEIAMTINPERKTEFKRVWIKTAEHQLFHELETEYGFPRATCRSLIQLMEEFIELNYGNLRGDKQIIYHAVSKDEPPGKQLDKIKTVSVKLTISHPEDIEILKKRGIHALRQHKMMRFATEAYDQGGLLVQEDLALLLNSGRRTIQRDMAYLKKQEIIIPTRGSIQDIGPTISHKTKIVELYLKGYEYTEIERRTRHTGQSIKRYIIGFSKVVMLHSKGFTPDQIRELTNTTEKVVKEYLELYHKYGELSKDRMDQLLSTPKIEVENKKKEMSQ